ncbi:hypothetical protein F5Y18DRAFT_423879 [Xylariaceae sp. FL1019]|nr:hypothetical protein F5Y18DRAFT_423879 [Xylariaceae sp. FL1019]
MSDSEHHQVSRPTAAARTKIIFVLALVIIWFIACLSPRYTPSINKNIESRLSEAKQKIPKVKIDWHPNYQDPRDRFNASKVALLVEPRPLPHLVPQILHMISVVPVDWRFMFIGSNHVLPDPWILDSKEDIHRLFTDPRFYDEFLPGVEWLLKYESDSILCANSEKSLDDWLHWDWTGAPRNGNNRFSGNGGLSLRRVSAIKRVLKFQMRYNDTSPEDEWFGSRILVLPGARVAVDQLAVDDIYVPNASKQFSEFFISPLGRSSSGVTLFLLPSKNYEDNFEVSSDIEKPSSLIPAAAVGYHIRDGGLGIADGVWKDHGRRREILDYCPELSLIMDMKLERERCEGDNLDGTIGTQMGADIPPVHHGMLESEADLGNVSIKLLGHLQIRGGRLTPQIFFHLPFPFPLHTPVVFVQVSRPFAAQFPVCKGLDDAFSLSVVFVDKPEWRIRTKIYHNTRHASKNVVFAATSQSLESYSRETDRRPRSPSTWVFVNASWKQSAGQRFCKPNSLASKYVMSRPTMRKQRLDSRIDLLRRRTNE